MSVIWKMTNFSVFRVAILNACDMDNDEFV
jgi:hypothetical protein